MVRADSCGDQVTDLAALEARIAARRARDLERWQAAYDAVPVETGKTCTWCGKPADRMSRDTDRVGPSCARCARPATRNPYLITLPQMAQRYGFALQYLRNQCSQGSLPVVRDGTRVYIGVEQAEQWIAGRDQAKSAAARRRWAR